MKRRWAKILTPAALALVAAPKLHAAPARPQVRCVDNITNGEDLVLLPGGKWVIASGFAGANSRTPLALYLIDVRTGQGQP